MLALFPVLCIGVLASQPFLSGQVSQRGDTLLHLQRLAQVNALMQHGVLYSRWAPDLALGFGYPLFNYYAPLAYYVTGWPMVLGVSQTTALAYGFVMCSVMAAIGMTTSGTFSPLRSLSIPPTSTRVMTWSSAISVTRSTSLPSSSNSRAPT